MPAIHRRISRLRWGDLLIVVLGVIAIGVHIRVYYPFYCDDALISLRYAQRLLEGHGLTWTDGTRVEGYSNLLWILLCAFLGRLGMDLIVATRVLGALCVVSVFAVLLFRRARTGATSRLPLAVATAAFALAAPVAVWALGGLETLLVAALLSWGLVLLIESRERAAGGRAQIMAAGVCFGLLSLTRPDGPLFTLPAAAWLLWTAPDARARMKDAATFLLWPVVLAGAQLAFRISYYGEWVPNVWYIKVSPSLSHLSAGAKYVAAGIFSLMPASWLAIVGLVAMARDPARRRPAILLLASMVAWLGYVAFIGGDIFHGRRHMVPFVVVMVLALVLAFEWLVHERTVPRGKSLPLAALAAGWFVIGQWLDESNQRAKDDLWVWNTEVVGRTLGDAFGESQPLLAVTAAGGIPYWSQLDCIDMLGLNDSTIARAVIPGLGQHWIGHEHADASYLMSRRPDLIHFGTAAGGPPNYLYKEQLADHPEFARDYSVCRIAGEKPYMFVAFVYVDRTSRKVGITATADSVHVPAYFIEGAASVWYPERRQFAIALSVTTVLGFRDLTLGPGTWELVLPSARAHVSFIDPETEAVIAPSVIDSVRTIHVATETTFDVMIRGIPERKLPVSGITLVRR